MGRDLKPGFTPDLRYRLYWVPKFSYLIVLTFDKSNTVLSLNTAYLVTDSNTHKLLRRLFPTPKVSS